MVPPARQQVEDARRFRRELAVSRNGERIAADDDQIQALLLAMWPTIYGDK